MELKEFLYQNTKLCVKTVNQNKNNFVLEVNGKIAKCTVTKFDKVSNIMHIQINNQPYKFSLNRKTNNNLVVQILNKAIQIELNTQTSHNKFYTKTVTPSVHTLTHANDSFHGAEKHILKSPLSGRIIRVLVNQNEKINQNHPILVIESMKMENEIRAPFNTFIKSILISEGNLVQQDQILIMFGKEGESNGG